MKNYVIASVAKQSLRCLLPWALLLIALCTVSPSYGAQAPPDPDAFLAGYLTAVLERDFECPPGSFDVEVLDNAALVRLRDPCAAKRWLVENTLEAIPGLREVVIEAEIAQVPDPEPAEGLDLETLVPTRVLPESPLFLPLLADPREPRFFVSPRRYQIKDNSYTVPSRSLTIAAVGYGGTFGLARWAGNEGKKEMQFSVDGALFAQFNLEAPSHDLLNADYIIGFPLTFRQGPWSMRLRVYHQSSHLGDEFLLRYHPERINLSYEAFSALGSWEGEFWRFYGGGEYLFHREPSDIEPGGFQWGVELHGPRDLPVGGRFLMGLDCKSRQENHWNLSVSLKAGFEFDPGAPGGRSLRLMALVYEGYSPHGQYYMDRVAFYGLSLTFGF